MALVYALIVLGALTRLVLLWARPTAARRFRSVARREMAERVERIGDATFLVAALGATVFGRGRPVALQAVWTLGVIAGLAMVGLAHELARRHRPSDGEAPDRRVGGPAASDGPTATTGRSSGTAGGPPSRRRVRCQ